MLTEGKKSAGNFSLEKICQDVLKVARLGEFDHRDWWGTHSSGPAGRVVLQKRLPRTRSLISIGWRERV